MAPAVSHHRLRRLAKLHRRGIEGADHALLALAESNPGELAAALGQDERWVQTARCSAEAADIIVKAFEHASTSARQNRLAGARRHAAAIAEVLGSELKPTAEGYILIPPGRLAELVAPGGYQLISLPTEDGPRVVDTTVLRRLLRECRRVERLRVSLAPTHLVLEYQTDVGRGRITLRTEPLSPVHDDVLAVPRPRWLYIHEENVPEPPAAPHLPAPPPMHPFLRHLFGAFGELVP